MEPDRLKSEEISVCIDDNRFISLINSALSEDGLMAQILQYCQQSEANFRTSWNWLESRHNNCPLAENAFLIVVSELSKWVSYIHGFHGCRITSDSTYCSNGICPLTPEWIEAEIIKWTGKLPSSGSEADALLKRYLHSYSGKICAVKSLSLHQQHGGYGHSLGSETLRNILQRHAPDALASYLKTGEPSIVELRIPISQLSPMAWENFVSDLLRIWLYSNFNYTRPSDPRWGGIILDHAVLPSWLIRRYSCDDNGKLTSKVYPYEPASSALPTAQTSSPSSNRKVSYE